MEFNSGFKGLTSQLVGEVCGGGVQVSASPSGFVASGEQISGIHGRVSESQSRSAHFREERNDGSLDVHLVAWSLY